MICTTLAPGKKVEVRCNESSFVDDDAVRLVDYPAAIVEAHIYERTEIDMRDPSGDRGSWEKDEAERYGN